MTEAELKLMVSAAISGETNRTIIKYFVQERILRSFILLIIRVHSAPKNLTEAWPKDYKLVIFSS